jgi:hypothetical protein
MLRPVSTNDIASTREKFPINTGIYSRRCGGTWVLESTPGCGLRFEANLPADGGTSAKKS